MLIRSTQLTLSTHSIQLNQFLLSSPTPHTHKPIQIQNVHLGFLATPTPTIEHSNLLRLQNPPSFSVSHSNLLRPQPPPSKPTSPFETDITHRLKPTPRYRWKPSIFVVGFFRSRLGVALLSSSHVSKHMVFPIWVWLLLSSIEAGCGFGSSCSCPQIFDSGHILLSPTRNCSIPLYSCFVG